MPFSLTDLAIQNFTGPGKYSDGPRSNGLSILLSPLASGLMSRTWLQRTFIKDPETGKTIRSIDRRLGVYPSVSLAEAREIAKANQSLADQGVDPRKEKLKCLFR